MRLRMTILTLSIGLVILSGCRSTAVDPNTAGPDTAVPAVPESEATVPVSQPATAIPNSNLGTSDLSAGEVPQVLFDSVLTDLSAVRGGKMEDVKLLKAEAVIWNDGSLGCPQPGVMYTQALVDGYQVVFDVDGEMYDYHLSETGAFVLCDKSFSSPRAVGTPSQ